MATAIATVVSLEGQAWAKSADGSLRALKVGDKLAPDEIVITAVGAEIELDFGDGHPVNIAGGQEVLMSRDLWTDLTADKQDAAVQDASVQEALTILNSGGDLTTELEETAAGVLGGSSGEGHGIVQLTRILEQTSPATFTLGVASAADNITLVSNVVAVNRAPLVAAQSFITDEDTVFNGKLVATDIENDTLNYSVTTQPANGSFTIDAATGAFVYTPTANYNGVDSVEVTVTDTRGNVTTSTVSFAINTVNDAPVSADQALVVGEDTALTGQIMATDVEGGVLSYSVTQVAANGLVMLDTATGEFVYTPNANFNGSDNFVVTVADSLGGSTSQTISVNVTAVNDAPVTANQSLTTAEAMPIAGNLMTTDVEGDTLAYSLSTAALHGVVTLNPATGAFIYTPDAVYNGSDNFVVTIDDGKGGTTTSTISVAVTPVDYASVISIGSGNVIEDIQPMASGTLTATDADNAALAFIPTTRVGGNGSLVLLEDGSWTYNLDTRANALSEGEVSSETFVVKLNDGSLTQISIDVTGTNDIPIASNQTLMAAEDIPLFNQVIANDVDGDVLSYSLTTAAAFGSVTVDALTGDFVYTPIANFNGTDSFVVTVSDGFGGTTTNTITLNVAAVNDAPVAVNNNLLASEDTAVIYTAAQLLGNDTDIELDILSITSATSGANGTATLNANGDVVFTPNANFNGVAEFTYTVTDGVATSNTATVSVAVAPLNDAPVAVNDSLAATEDMPSTYTVAQLLGNDSDVELNTISIASVTSGAHGIAVLNPDGTVTFTPNTNFNGVADFTYTITDGSLVSNAAVVAVAVAPANDAPVAVNNDLLASEDASVTYTAAQLLGNDVDIDLNTLSIASVTSGANGTATLNANGDVTFTPNANFNGTADFTYSITDGVAISNTVTVSVAVAAVNDAPIAQAASFSVVEDAAVITGVLTASDIDSNAVLTFSLSGVAPAGLTVNSDGTYNFDASNAVYQSLGIGQTSIITVPYTVTDDQTATSTADLVITVTGTNDAPVAQAASFTVAEDAAVINGSVVAGDVDTNAILSFALNGVAPAGLTFNSNGTYSFDASNVAYQSLSIGQTSMISVPYTVTDDQATASTANLMITVTGTNDLPITSTQNIMTNEDASSTGSILSSDTDGDALTYSMGTLAAHGNVVLNTATGDFTYNPTVNYSGTDSFIVNIDDGHGDLIASTVNVTVAAVADTPSLTAVVVEHSGITSIPMAVPASEGLTSEHFVGIASVAPADANNLSIVEAAIELTTATSTDTITDVSYPGIAADDAYHIQGFIFLEAGHTYQLEGSRDDTLLVKIGGTEVYSVSFNTWGNLYKGESDGGPINVTPTPLAIARSGFYSFEVIIYNGDHGGNLNLDLSVDGQPALDINTTNFNLYTDISTVNSAGAFVSNGDGGFHPLLNIDTHYNYFSLNVSAALTDIDGSESLTVNAGGIPVGTTLTDGAHIFVASAALTSTDVSDWNLAELTVIPAMGQINSFDVTFTATATDGASVTSETLVASLVPSNINDATYHVGTAVDDNLIGLSGVDAMFGLNSDDTLNGNGGGDLFVGGAGNDTMTSSGVGADTFKWNFGNQGTVAAPANDVLVNFNTSQGDTLNLSDLLQNEAGADLTNYLHFEISGADTTLSISTSGAFDGNNYATATDQTIVLSNLNLTGADTAIIDQLKNNGNLITD